MDSEKVDTEDGTVESAGRMEPNHLSATGHSVRERAIAVFISGSIRTATAMLSTVLTSDG